MKYVVEYNMLMNMDPSKIHTFETRSKVDLKEFLAKARKYNGSYYIVDKYRVSEAKKNKGEKLPL
jgi:hypothetical protein